MDFEAAKALCRSFAGCTEDIKWSSNRVFSVGGKMFAATGTETLTGAISFKVEDDRFLELTDRPGIIPAPYLARHKWVRIERADALSEGEAPALLRRSYALVFAKLTKQLQRALKEGDASPLGHSHRPVDNPKNRSKCWRTRSPSRTEAIFKIS